LLRWRIISAIVIIAIFGGLSWLDYAHPLFGLPGMWLFPTAIVAAALSSLEMSRIVLSDQTNSQKAALAVGNVIIVMSAAVPLFWKHVADSEAGQLGWPMTAFVLALGVAFATTMRSYRSGEPALSRLARTVLALAYVGVLQSFFVALRLHGTHEQGFVAILSLIVVVKLGDTGAYTVGRLIGGSFSGDLRLAPQLSPKKTLEGAGGAILFGCIGSWLMFCVIGPWLAGTKVVTTSTIGWLAYGVVLAIAGMFGDLAESLLKREGGVKDSGSGYLPGIGGVLDLVDSLLFSAPLAYLFWSVGVVSV
jgi:phosphatidate cytidylyltransferase